MSLESMGVDFLNSARLLALNAQKIFLCRINREVVIRHGNQIHVSRLS